MTPIGFIFALVDKFVPMELTEKQSLKMEATAWETSTKTSKNKFEQLYNTYASKWAIRLFLAVMFIPVVKWILKSENQSPSNDEQY